MQHNWDAARIRMNRQDLGSAAGNFRPGGGGGSLAPETRPHYCDAVAAMRKYTPALSAHYHGVDDGEPPCVAGDLASLLPCASRASADLEKMLEGGGAPPPRPTCKARLYCV